MGIFLVILCLAVIVLYKISKKLKQSWIAFFLLGIELTIVGGIISIGGMSGISLTIVTIGLAISIVGFLRSFN